ncbi:D-amino acid aminotransferase [Methylophaga sp. OBS4]|uniref:D-amino acid aminotransferase n=1 Tax=Methylophaga sp. OBS4 TaxID=2991935 RepID=UPI00224E3044|nr:D-amino acid aminotransferase [Methylophaga sp. OBS4]MCX4188375.1 D-amino acid aminotransferase [Methylophaga sp. OBS4]
MRTVYLNGEFMPAEQAKVSVFDRGFLLGDGVYEVIPVYDGLPFRLLQHLQRLQRSLNGVRMANPHTDDEWTSIIARLVTENGGGDQAVYLQVTRGVAARDHVFPEGVEPTAFVMSNHIKPLPASYKTEGVKAITVADIRWAQCDIKAITLLPNSLLRQQAEDAGAQEALLIRDGYLTEGSASNAYAVIEGVIYTAPKDEKVLPGITRDLVLELANKAGLPYLEQAVTEQQLNEASEIWISSSTREVLPVTTLNNKPVADGKPGPIWQQIERLYQRYKREGTM